MPNESYQGFLLLCRRLCQDHVAHPEELPEWPQTIALLSDSANPNLCPVIHTLRSILRARRLKQPNSMPPGCYQHTKKTLLVYMMANSMASLIQEAVKQVHARISAKDLSKYSTH
jgi:hypothetical protein